MTSSLYHIDLPYACYGIIIIDGVVHGSPPIARWMIGKPAEVVMEWLKSRNAKIEIV